MSIRLVPETTTTLLSAPTKLRICLPCIAERGDRVGANKSGHCVARCRTCGERLSQIYTFSLPAVKSCPGAVFERNAHIRAPGLLTSGHDTVCDHCYADGRGNYVWKVVQEAQARRLQWIVRALATDETRKLAADTLVAAVRPVTKATLRFRLHESGDFLNPRYVDMWRMVAESLPEVTFWAPTRVWHMRSDAWQDALRAFSSLPNVVCRPSALQLDVAAPYVPFMAAPGNVHTAEPLGALCPASTKEIHNCGPCTACWDQPSVARSYQAHTLQEKAA